MMTAMTRYPALALILLATVPPLLFFWVIVPPLAAIVVWVGVLSGGFADEAAAPAAR